MFRATKPPNGPNDIDYNHLSSAPWNHAEIDAEDLMLSSLSDGGLFRSQLKIKNL